MTEAIIHFNTTPLTNDHSCTTLYLLLLDTVKSQTKLNTGLDQINSKLNESYFSEIRQCFCQISAIENPGFANIPEYHLRNSKHFVLVSQVTLLCMLRVIGNAQRTKNRTLWNSIFHMTTLLILKVTR